MAGPTNNKKVILSIGLGLIAIPIGILGWLAMFLVGTLESVYVPHLISAAASITAISVAVLGIREIETHGDTQNGRGIGILGIVIGALNILLLVFYYASY